MNVNPFSYLIEKLKSKADKGESAPPTDDNIPANADLNNYSTVGFYHCGGGNTVANKPTGVGAFGLIVIHSAGGSYYEQRLTDSYSGKSYLRYGVSGTWSSWGAVKTTSGSVSIQGDGVKDWKTILNELYALADYSKINVNSILQRTVGTNITTAYQFYAKANNSRIEFTRTTALKTTDYFEIETIRLETSSSCIITSTKNGYTDSSSSIVPSNNTLTLIY